MRFRFSLPKGFQLQDIIALNQMMLQISGTKRWATWALRAVFFLGGAAMIGYSAFLLVSGGKYGMEYLYYGSVPAIMGVGLVVSAFNYYKRNAKKSLRAINKSIGSFQITFYDDHVEETSKNGTLQHQYEEFERAVQFQDMYFLFLEKDRVFPLPFWAITEGDVEAFPAFWEDRHGVEVKKM